MAGTGTADLKSFQRAYGDSFGNLPHETRYYDPVHLKSDMRAEGGHLHNVYQAGLKAMNVSGMPAGTTDKAIIPIYLDPTIIDTSRKFTPLVEVMPRVSNMGVTAEWTTVSKGSAFTALEDAAFSEANDTYTRHSVPMKYLYAVGRITGQTLAAVPSFMLVGATVSAGTPEGSFGTSSAPNAMQLEVLLKTREIKELEENLIVNGNATTSAITGNPDTTEYDGIIQQMSTTNTVGKSTSPITLNDINTAIANAFDKGGRPNLGVCSSGVYTDLLNLLTAKIGYLQPTKQVFWGFTSVVLNTMVGEVPVIPSMFMSNTTGSKAIYFLDMSVCEMRVLQDLTYEALAKTNDSQKFMLKIYEAFIIKNTSFCSSITAISA